MTGLFFEAPLLPQGRRLFDMLERHKGERELWHTVARKFTNVVLRPYAMEDPTGMIPYGHIAPRWEYHGIRWTGGNVCELTPNGVWRVRCALVDRGHEVLMFADWVLSWAISSDVVLYTRHEYGEEDEQLRVTSLYAMDLATRPKPPSTPPSRWDV